MVIITAFQAEDDSSILLSRSFMLISQFMNNAEKFEQNLLKSSVSNNLDAAKREWSLYLW